MKNQNPQRGNIGKGTEDMCEKLPSWKHDFPTELRRLGSGFLPRKPRFHFFYSCQIYKIERIAFKCCNCHLYNADKGWQGNNNSAARLEKLWWRRFFYTNVSLRLGSVVTPVDWLPVLGRHSRCTKTLTWSYALYRYIKSNKSALVPPSRRSSGGMGLVFALCVVISMYKYVPSLQSSRRQGWYFYLAVFPAAEDLPPA